MPLPADVIARIPLLPVLAVQGLGVRRRALTLPEPPGPRTGEAGTGPPLRLLIAGDSSAAGVGAPTQAKALSGRLVADLARTHSVSWRLEAETGATTKDTMQRLEGLQGSTFDVAVCALGVNDTTRATSRKRWLARQTALASLLTDRLGVRLIVASGLPPMGKYPMLPNPLRWVLGQHAQRLDHALAELAHTHPALQHLALDLPFDPRFQAEDGYHPSVEAYELWAKLIADRIRRELSFKG